MGHLVATCAVAAAAANVTFSTAVFMKVPRGLEEGPRKNYGKTNDGPRQIPKTIQGIYEDRFQEYMKMTP